MELWSVEEPHLDCCALWPGPKPTDQPAEIQTRTNKQWKGVTMWFMQRYIQYTISKAFVSHSGWKIWKKKHTVCIYLVKHLSVFNTGFCCGLALYEYNLIRFNQSSPELQYLYGDLVRHIPDDESTTESLLWFCDDVLLLSFVFNCSKFLHRVSQNNRRQQQSSLMTLADILYGNVE